MIRFIHSADWQLGAQAAALQILILTCHSNRYRGLGQPTTSTVAS